MDADADNATGVTGLHYRRLVAAVDDDDDDDAVNRLRIANDDL